CTSVIWPYTGERCCCARRLLSNEASRLKTPLPPPATSTRESTPPTSRPATHRPPCGAWSRPGSGLGWPSPWTGCARPSYPLTVRRRTHAPGQRQRPAEQSEPQASVEQPAEPQPPAPLLA